MVHLGVVDVEATKNGHPLLKVHDAFGIEGPQILGPLQKHNAHVKALQMTVCIYTQ